jgi:signal transduction histidine kinase
LLRQTLMKFFKSIRWRLQIWYGVILGVVLAGFGLTAYQLERVRQFRQIDDQLRRRAAALADTLRPQPPRGPPPAGRGAEIPPPGQPPSEPPAEPDGANPRPGPGPLFRLPPHAADLFDENNPNGFYYVVWSRNGNEMARSTNAPQTVPPPDRPGPGPEPPRMRDRYREAFLITAPGETVLVGRSVAPELSDLGLLGWKLSAVGGAILLLGLAGGWTLASRFIRPIEHISAAAAKISAGDLSQRIDVSDSESELGALANVLNSTFAQIEAAFEQQKNFTSDAAHELRTPVAVVLTQTQAALTRDRTSAEYRETIESCERAAQRMRRLTESLFELARLDAGEGLKKRTSFDLSGAVRECVELIRPMAVEAGVELLCQLPPVQCVGDPNRIGQVIVNLLTNAIQYNHRNGRVHIMTEWQSGTAILTITDNGAGITEKDLPHIFRRFYRADTARSSGRGGLGLAISKAIIEAHGGKINVSSQLNIGSTFSVYLPSPE